MKMEWERGWGFERIRFTVLPSGFRVQGCRLRVA